MTVLLLFGVFGVIYSVLPTLFGAHFTHFLPLFWIIKALFLGIFVAIIGIIVERWISRDWIQSLVTGTILASYFGTWIILYSSVSKKSAFVLGLVLIGSSIFLISLAYWFHVLASRSNLSLFTHFTFGFLLLVGGWLLLSNLPPKVLSEQVFEGASDRRLSAGEIVYPFSISLNESTARYSWLMGDYDPDEAYIMVVLDALRKDYLGKKVDGTKITPTLDRVAKDGFFFRRYYTQASWTKPSTASLFTGLYQHDHGLCASSDIREQAYAQRLPSTYDTLAERLKRREFTTLGSAFVEHLNKTFQFGQGFDIWVAPDTGFRESSVSQRLFFFKLIRDRPEKVFVYLHTSGPHAPYKQALLNTPFWKGTPYYNDGKLRFEGWDLPHPRNFNRGTLDHWKQKHDKPMMVDEIRILRYLYTAELNFVDRFLMDRTIQSMKNVGLYSDATLMVTGDHGEALLDNYKSGRARFGHFQSLRESVINPPLIMKLPENSSYEPVIDPDTGLVESVDLTRTLLEFAGASTHDLRGDNFLKRSGNDTYTGKQFRHALAERCGITREEFPDLSQMSREDLQRDLAIVESAYVSQDWKLLSDLKNQKYSLFRIGKDYREEFQRTLNSDQKLQGVVEELKNSYRQTIGKHKMFERLPGKMIRLKEETRENLKGLGYLE